MRITEANEAFMKKCPVRSGGIEYRRISALIKRASRNNDGTIVIEAELESCKGNSVTVTPISNVEAVTA